MFKPGDRVVMNNRCYVSPEKRGKVWTVRSHPWTVCGSEVVLLHGYSGGYAVEGLTRANHIHNLGRKGLLNGQDSCI